MAISGLQEAPLTVQENALAYSMLHSLGNVTVNFAMAEPGADRLHRIGMLSAGDLGRLTASFAADPKERLAWARESLFAINQDTRLSDHDRGRRLDRYLDAYSDLTVKLDRAAFPPTPLGVVNEGIPDYIPDGFIDMGRERSRDAAHRDREQIGVDKHEILTKYRPLLREIFATDYSGMSPGEKKLRMAKRIGVGIWEDMTDHDKVAALAPGESLPSPDLGGGKVRLSQLPEGVCRHKALVFQVLAQAVGIKSAVIKARLNGQRHAANMIRVDKKWYIYDVSQPVYRLRADGSKDLRPARYPADGPPPARAGEVKQYTVSRLALNDTHYSIQNEMYWRILPVRR